MKTIDTFVVATNSSGETELILVKVRGSVDMMVEDGEHLDVARSACSNKGFDPIVAFDINEPAARTIKMGSILTQIQADIA